MNIIGVVGKAGVGKTTFLNNLKFDLFSCSIVIVDLFVHELIKKDKFYQDLLLFLTGTLDRNKMRQILFNDPTKMKLIESYVGNKLTDEVNSLAQYFDYIVIESANLDKFPISPKIYIELICPEEIRINRLIERDGIEKATDLINFQKNLTYNHINDRIIFNTKTDYYDKLLTIIKQL